MIGNWRVAALGLAGWLAMSGHAAAQSCVGRPVPATARALVAEVGYASYRFDSEVEGTDVGVRYWANPRGVIGYGVGYTRRIPSGGGAGINLARGDVTLEPPSPLPLPVPLQLCAAGGVDALFLAGGGEGTSYTSYTIPVGLGMGLPLPLRGAALVAFAVPQAHFTRGSGEVFGIPVEQSYTAFGAEGGLGLARGALIGRLVVRYATRPAEAGLTAHPDLGVALEAGVRF